MAKSKTRRPITYLGSVESIYEPPFPDAPKFDFIFVHDPGTNWQNAWSQTAQPVSWIRDFLPREFPNSRVWAYTLEIAKPTRFTEDTSGMQFESLLTKVGKKKSSHRSIVFIAYNLGGLLLQDLLRGCSECASSYVQGIILFGVLCSSKADDDWMNPILAASNITNPDSPVSREACYEIRKIGQKLINDEFETWVEDFKLKDRVICLYETLAVPKYHNLVVSQQAAVISGCDSMALEADHLQMARFSEEADINYQKVILALRSVCCPRNEVYTNIMLPARLHSGRLRNLPVTSDLCEELLLAEDSDRDAKPSGLAEDSDRDAKPSGPLALLLEHQGHYTKAEEFFANLAQDYGSSLGSQHRLTLYCLDKKASLLCKRGAYEDAEELIRKNLKIRISTSGKTCLSVLLNSCTMASSLISRGYYGTAEKLLCDALEYSSSSYPGNVAWVQLLNCLATTSVRCQSAGFGSRFNTEYLAVKVVGESISLYGEKHPFTLNHMSDLADGLASRSQFAEAEAIGRFVLNATSQVLGSHHPQVLRSAQRLADYIRCQHRYNEAATSLKSTLELQKRKQGNWNPDTLTTMKSLGLVYILQGYLQNAEEVLEQTYVGMKQVLGKEHPTSIWVSQLLIRLKAEQNTNLDSVEGTDHSDAIRTSPSGMHPGADYDFFSSALDDEVIKAARKGDTISLQTTLRENKVGTRVFERALREAASNGQNEALKVLLKDYSVNSQDGLYGTPLQAACYFGEYDTVQFLLEHNADINVRGGVCGNALQAAVLGRQPRILELLLTRDLSSDIGKECLNSSLSTAILTKQNQLVPKLRHAGADVNCKDYLFGSPLQQASFFGQKEVMTILLKEGASTSLPGGIFECPLKAAIASGNRPCVLLLLDSGASIGQLYSKPASKMEELTAANEAFLKSVILEKMKASQLPLSRNSLEKPGLVPDTNNLTLSKAEETRGLQLQKGADVQLTSDTKPPNNLQTTSHRPGAKNLEVRYENTTSTSGTLDTETSSSRASNVSRCKQYLTEKSKNAKKGFKKRFQGPHRVNEKEVATR